jgi:hypothetical protein
MMSEGQVRQLFTVLQEKMMGSKDPIVVASFAGGMSALGMVLEEENN